MNIVTVIQARTTSSRLPGKVLKPILDKPLLVHLVKRVKAAKNSGTIVVATTTLKEDNQLVNLCKEEGILYFRGNPTDLIDRHYQAGVQYFADAVVKIPSDCPLIDPEVIDQVLRVYLDNPWKYDYVSNLHPPSFPDGNDVEIIPMGTLYTAWQEAGRTYEREHTTPYIWEQPGRFRIGNVLWEAGLDLSMSHRWTIDYEEDYQFIKAVYEELYPVKPLFNLYDILFLLKQRPELASLNSRYAGVNWYRHHLGELRTISPRQTRRIPGKA